MKNENRLKGAHKQQVKYYIWSSNWSVKNNHDSLKTKNLEI